MQSYVLMLQTDPDDKYLTESALAETGNNVPVKFIGNIDELENLVAGSGAPAVILLNDRGATHKGNEVLKELKTHAAYSHIPVVVLGEVSTDEYIRQCYRSGANTFITKPSTIAATRKKIELFFAYWFDVASV